MARFIDPKHDLKLKRITGRHPELLKVVKKICFCTIFTVAVVAGLLVIMTSWFYITCPVYSFEEPKPFFGTSFYNPYQTISDDAWKKCVFHVHTKNWLGLTNGESSDEEMIDAYRQLNFDVITISDYMKINNSRAYLNILKREKERGWGRMEQSDMLLYIPAYEHGYNIKKAHQLALGAKRVVWRDYFFPQNLHQKQHIIDVLKKNSRLVAINHPTMRSSYRQNDFTYLSGYDLLEVQNGTHLSEATWDKALSNGHPVWLIANDDSHSVSPERLQREVTFVNIPQSADNPNDKLPPSSSDILKYLEQGVAFGVHFPRNKQSTMQEKIEESLKVSFPVSIQILDDTLHVVWQQTMQRIDFIGDNGRLLKTITDSDAAFYPVRLQDSYVRVKLTSPDGLVYYLNPIIRSSENMPEKQSLSHIDTHKTFWKRTFFALSFGTFFLLIAIKFHRSVFKLIKKNVN